MKKHKILTAIIIVAILAAAGVLYICLTDTKILVQTSGRSIQKNVTAETVAGQLLSPAVIFYENGVPAETGLTEIGVVPALSEESVSYIENSFAVDFNSLSYDYDTSGLESALETLNESRSENVYSAITQNDDGTFSVTEESAGDYLDTESLCVYIMAELESDVSVYADSVAVKLEDFYVPVDETLPTESELQAKVDGLSDVYIEYENGWRLSLIDLSEYLETDGYEITFNEDSLPACWAQIDYLLEVNLIEYDTVGDGFAFTTSAGEEITVTGGTYGDYFSSDDEADYVLTFFLASLEENGEKSETGRLPIYSQDMDDEIGDTYVEISIDDQHVWYYEDGELVMETDCVTGTKGSHDTPTGVYYVSEKVNGKYLTGDDYKTWVNKWMRLTGSGVGLHDATWRSSFGGSIYVTNGSHGCINLPYSFASSLYDLIETGIPVIIY